MPFPILFRTTLTKVLHYGADCDIASHSLIKAFVLRSNQVISHTVNKEVNILIQRWFTKSALQQMFVCFLQSSTIIQNISATDFCCPLCRTLAQKGYNESRKSAQVGSAVVSIDYTRFTMCKSSVAVVARCKRWLVIECCTMVWWKRLLDQDRCRRY